MRDLKLIFCPIAYIYDSFKNLFLTKKNNLEYKILFNVFIKKPFIWLKTSLLIFILLNAILFILKAISIINSNLIFLSLIPTFFICFYIIPWIVNFKFKYIKDNFDKQYLWLGEWLQKSDHQLIADYNQLGFDVSNFVMGSSNWFSCLLNSPLFYLFKLKRWFKQINLDYKQINSKFYIGSLLLFIFSAITIVCYSLLWTNLFDNNRDLSGFKYVCIALFIFLSIFIFFINSFWPYKLQEFIFEQYFNKQTLSLLKRKSNISVKFEYESNFVLVINQLIKSWLIYLPITNFVLIDNIRTVFISNNVQKVNNYDSFFFKSVGYSFLIWLLTTILFSAILVPIIHFLLNDSIYYLYILVPTYIFIIFISIYLIPIIYIKTAYQKLKDHKIEFKNIYLNKTLLDKLGLSTDDFSNDINYFNRPIIEKKILIFANKYKFLKWQFIYCFQSILKYDINQMILKIKKINLLVEIISWITFCILILSLGLVIKFSNISIILAIISIIIIVAIIYSNRIYFINYYISKKINKNPFNHEIGSNKDI